jgi:hypothetical protein
MKHLLVVLILVVNAQMVAQGTRPDPLVEAAVYASRAQQSIGCESGETLAKKALATARRFRSLSQTERDTSGAFIAQTAMLVGESQQRRKFLDGESLEITKLLQAGKVESARARITADNPPSCDGRFEQFMAIVNARATQARILQANGEEMVGRDPKAAQRLFEQAKNLNAELPGIDQRIADAKASRSHRAWGRSIGRVALYTVVIAAAGVGAYYGYQQYERSQTPVNAARRGPRN